MNDLRLGDWRDVLADVEEVDAVICDPPYSDRVAKGQRSATAGDNGGSFAHRDVGGAGSTIHYGFVTREDVAELVGFWTPRIRRWFVMFGDHYTVPWALSELGRAGFYAFAPVAWVKTNAAPRFVCDGPSSSLEYIAIARPRAPYVQRYRPGYYQGAGGSAYKGAAVTGGKPEWLMRAIIRDYSEPGDLIADPFAGGASTLRAAAMEGRRAIGAEIDPETHAKGVERLRQPFTLRMPFDALEGVQPDLLEGGL